MTMTFGCSTNNPNTNDNETGSNSSIFDTANPESSTDSEDTETPPSSDSIETPPQEEPDVDPYKGYYEFFRDIGFKLGFIVTSPINGSGIKNIGTLRITEGTTPIWTLAQWGSNYNIMDNADNLPVSVAGAHSFHSKFINGRPAKRATVYDSGAIKLELNASLEYDKPREPDDPWPHLLISQDYNSNSPRLSYAKDIRMIMDFTLDSFTDHMGDAANDNIHAAQFVWYVTLQNRNKQSPGYGEYLWFGLNLFDNRYEYPHFYAAHDGGTSAMIYQPDGKDYLPHPVKVGEPVHIDFCLSDHAKKAFELGQERGYMLNSKWEDLYIGGMNTGFEIPGTYDIAVTIRNISIKYKY